MPLTASAAPPGVLTASAASLAVLTASDAPGPGLLGLLDETGRSPALDEAGGFILTESGA